MNSNSMRPKPVHLPKTSIRPLPIAGAVDRVRVYCRVRPNGAENGPSCVRVCNATSIALRQPPPKLSTTSTTPRTPRTRQRELLANFRHVFDDCSTQVTVFGTVAQPLLESLLLGRSGLLFSYGVTGSGKTYTMTGGVHGRGLLQRCLGALFATIAERRADRCVFQPDHLNSFELLTPLEARGEQLKEQQQLRYAGANKPRHEPPPALSRSEPELRGLNREHMYSVFVSYIEIYNNSVYDLLAETEWQRPEQPPQSKILREDAAHNVYVHGVVELEMDSAEQAVRTFSSGQRRKRMASTVLNAESSRSHTVFNIRLVQAPRRQDAGPAQGIIVSQLSLVDLAGSERYGRTQNSGARLREAGNINNSLMTLRSCLESVRENQLLLASGAGQAQLRKIPYRDTKITHLFKQFFGNEGEISMIVCINSRAEDYDENVHVMKFAELTQEVQVVPTTPRFISPQVALLNERHKIEQIYKIGTKNLNKLLEDAVNRKPINIDLQYILGAEFPAYDKDSTDVNSILQDASLWLQQRIKKRKELSEDFDRRCDAFRCILQESEKENESLRQVANSKVITSKNTAALEDRLSSYNHTISFHKVQLEARERRIRELKCHINKLEIINGQDEDKENRHDAPNTDNNGLP